MSASTYVSRDPFAREELHKTREKGAECAWCGRHDAQEEHTVLAGHTDSYPTVAVHVPCPAVHGRVYRFHVESDGGRTYQDSHTFCGKSCRAAYHG